MGFQRSVLLKGGIFLRSLKHLILFLMLSSLLLLAASFILVLGWQTQDRAVTAAMIKAKTDLATCTEILNLRYPGDWHTHDGIFYKGDTLITNNLGLVDYLSELTGDTITVFLGDTRVATTIRSITGERAFGTKVSDSVAETVLKDGQTYLGEANVLGQSYWTAYEPIWDNKGNIIGMFNVGISPSYAHEMFVDSIEQMALLGGALTVLVMLLAWICVRKMITRPLHEIALGTRDVATGHLTPKVEVSGPKEIGELAGAFNLLVEQLEGLAGEITRVASREERGCRTEEAAGREVNADSQVGVAEPHGTGNCLEGKGLPKGLNQDTLRLVIAYLQGRQSPVSAEEVAEGVKLTRVTVRRYLEFLEQCGVLRAECKYGAVGRPVRVFSGITIHHIPGVKHD